MRESRTWAWSWMEKTLLVSGAVISALLVIFCFIDNEYNFLTHDQRGYRFFEEGNFSGAAVEFSALEWKGVALYRDGRFEEAAAAFSGKDSPANAFNRGNSLLMLGKYEEAIERYERALSLRPDWEAARNNLSIARARAKALEKKGGEMTGGKLGADEYVFSNNPSEGGEGEEVVEGAEPSDAEKRAIWLRQVQTRPADFLRSKFAYQYQLVAGAAVQTAQPGTPEKEGQE